MTGRSDWTFYLDLPYVPEAAEMAVVGAALGDAAAWPIQGLIKNFRDEIEERIRANKAGRMAAE